ncbi:DNA/RNA non-specific endonuclease [Candidatus Poribacteria bacterium]|nr:DNA/RNA non-specific endonuclease [Candidatus Poribacteria bacterium]
MLGYEQVGLKEQQQEALKRYTRRAQARQDVVNNLKVKNPLEVDIPSRVRTRKDLVDPRDGLALERIMGASDLFPISYLEAGLNAGKPVCRIEVRDNIGRVLGHGTGFLVSPVLLLTNHHVLEDEAVARFSLAQFNYETDLQLMPRPIKSFRLDPDRLFINDKALDFALVAVDETSGDGVKLSEFGFLRLLSDSGKALLGEYVSIIQHASGAPKAVAIRENRVIDTFENFVHYATDTEPGASGSPVFNDGWDVVALHHAGVPDPNDSAKYVANEGIRISSIIKLVVDKRDGLSSDRKRMLDQLVEGVPKPERMLVTEQDMEWYEDSAGYDPSFLGQEWTVPLPSLQQDLKDDVAPLKDGGEVLNYTHFSIVLSKSRRMAYYTAVNIDGSSLENIKRDADKWYFDPRIVNKYQCGPKLYEKNDLDRGHLVRRLDPVWGDEASEANEDTFHFTNCCPQHKNLNQKTWQNLEDYILKNAGKHDIKVSVFTGPVFREDDMLYREEFRIPAEFWKVVAMVKEDGELSATAYLQTQKNLIQDLEFAYGKYKTYQVPVSQIEHLTGLKFGKLCDHDPIAGIESTVGRVIERPADIRL